MILISHRGNTHGRSERFENSPEYIDKAIESGYDVEIDVRVIDGVLFLGHDEPQHVISQNWLNKRREKLWIHCKNVAAVEWFSEIDEFNWFWHENDMVTLTSKKYAWAYPGKQPIRNSIAVMPEIYDDNIDYCLGICSDNIHSYKK